MNWIKKHKKLLLWLVGLGAFAALLYWLYQQGASSNNTSQTPNTFGGTFTTNYIEAVPGMSTTPAAASTPTTNQTSSGASEPVYGNILPIAPPPQTLFQPSLASANQVTLPALPPSGSFTNLGGGLHRVDGGSTGYPVGTILNIVPPKGARTYDPKTGKFRPA